MTCANCGRRQRDLVWIHGEPYCWSCYREKFTAALDPGYEPVTTIPAWAVFVAAAGLLAGVYLLLTVLG